MNNKIFINRCETILITMRNGNMSSIRTQQVANWIETQDNIAGQVMAKMCQLNLFKKVGAARNTCYELTDQCNNSFIAAISEHKDILKATAKVVDYFVNKKSVVPVVDHTPSQSPISSKAKQAIILLRDLIKENEDLQAEVELLREENTKLHEIEKKYNQITELIRIK